MKGVPKSRIDKYKRLAKAVDMVIAGHSLSVVCDRCHLHPEAIARAVEVFKSMNIDSTRQIKLPKIAKRNKIKLKS
jgi:hypothetical protein